MNPKAIEKRLGLTVEHLRRAKDRRPDLLGLFRKSREGRDPHNHEAVSRAVLKAGGQENPDGYVAVVDSDHGPIAVTTKPYQGPPVDDLPTFDPREVQHLENQPREAVAAAVRTKREFPGSRVTSPGEVREKLRRKA